MCKKTFLYFAYGSNLLNKRIHISNPSAVKYGIGKLENYRLDFMQYSNKWLGCSATIVAKLNSCVWGTIYEMSKEHQATLDEQEGVDGVHNKYRPLQVDVEASDGKVVSCRTYQQVEIPPDCGDLAQLPKERQPSKVYMNVIILGALESRLPENYVKFLKSIAHNGYSDSVGYGTDFHKIKI